MSSKALTTTNSKEGMMYADSLYEEGDGIKSGLSIFEVQKFSNIEKGGPVKIALNQENSDKDKKALRGGGGGCQQEKVKSEEINFRHFITGK